MIDIDLTKLKFIPITEVPLRKNKHTLYYDLLNSVPIGQAVELSFDITVYYGLLQTKHRHKEFENMQVSKVGAKMYIANRANFINNSTLSVSLEQETK